MDRLITAVILGSLAMMQNASGQSKMTPGGSGIVPANAAAVPTDIPAMPRGKSTIFGGKIQVLDPVRDQLTLKVFGERPMKILFDERTEVYRDGQRVSVRALKAEERASVQTTLDGTKLFAVSIHILSNPEQGDYEGRVLNFNQATGELTVSSGPSLQTAKVLVESNTAFAREGQTRFSSQHAGAGDLVEGALVSVEFGLAGKDEPVASRITVLAVPGSRFVLSGNLTSMDLHAGVLVLSDRQNDKSYQVSFNPADFPSSQSLHVGDSVRVDADYDGTRYAAVKLAKN